MFQDSCESSNESDIEIDLETPNRNSRKFFFEKGHPRRQTIGHRYRKLERWPKFSGKRIPDVETLSDNSDLSNQERDSKREEYAQAVLLMFYPFRSLQGNGFLNI